MDPIMELARQHDLVVIEDAAEAIGSAYRSKLCGAIGHIGCFSFYANKTITCGEGGMVVSNLPELADKARYYRNMCFPLTDAREYQHQETGFNYRMPNTVAAIGLAQLERVDHYVECRRRNAGRYNARLLNIEGLTTPVEEPWAVNSYWMYAILVEDEFGPDRDAVMRGLHDKGIDTRKFFQPMHLQGCMAAYLEEGMGSYPVSDEIAERGFYLPSGSGLTEEQIAYICSCLAELRAA
jgi:perosamine synthetase